MKTSTYWIGYFKANARQQRINWETKPQLTHAELTTILYSLQIWQLGETSEGVQLTNMAARHAIRTNDPDYLEATKLFIKEEQKHGNNLGRYLDAIGKPRIKNNLGDNMFRFIRHLNSNMEMLTLTVLVVESTAQIFYQALKDATNCTLLKEICTDILIDEAHHITFQTERLANVYCNKNAFSRVWRKKAYKYFFYATACVVWFAHSKLFKAGGNTFSGYLKKMRYKYIKTLDTITGNAIAQFA